VSSASLRYLHCVDVGPHRVLFVAPAIDCNSERYHRYMVLPILVLIIDVIVAPAAIGWFLSRNVAKMYPRQAFGARWVSSFHPLLHPSMSTTFLCMT
jgi:hypothetical protein